MTAPPPLARRVLSALLPPEHRGVVLAHLDGEFAERERSLSEGAPRRWYWRQALGSLPGACRLRVRSLGHGLGQDVRHAFQLFMRRPGFSAAVTITLTLAIGATSAVMTVANAVLLRPLPFHEPDRVVSIAEIDRVRQRSGEDVSWPDFLAYQGENRTLDVIAGYNGGSRTWQIDGGLPERLAIASVTQEFFTVLGVSPALGRAFTEEDSRQGAPQVLILTHAAWRARFGADPSALGRTVDLNGSRATIVGVWPAAFEFPPRGLADVWLPLRMTDAQRDRSYYHWLNVIARLKPGVTIDQAQDDLDRIARRIGDGDPTAHANAGATVTRLRDRIVREPRPVLLLLSWAAACVLLVACANVAGLLLARGTVRRSEVDVRSALGASRWRLARQLLLENVVLAVPGGMLGIWLGQWAVRTFVATLPSGQRTALPHLANLQLDATTVTTGMALLLFAVLAFGLIPALRISRGTPAETGRGTVGRSRHDLRLQLTLVSAQVALALMLLSGAGLMTQSLRRLFNVSPGFRTEGLLTFTLSLSGPRYGSPEATAQLFATVLGRVSALPGVEGATAIDQLPLTGAGNSGVFTTTGDAGAREHDTLVRTVMANYFTVMGVPVVRGRAWEPTDQSVSPRVVVINQHLASALGSDAVGRRIAFPFTGVEPWEIVGVVGDERFDAIDQPVRPVVYFEFDQSVSGAMSLLVRTASEPLAIVPTIRQQVAEVDPGLPAFNVTTMEAILESSEAVFRRRAVLMLLAGFAIAGITLAAVGLYGVLAQLVADRTREIGVRIALGAGRAQVVGAILRRGFHAAVAGILLGIVGSVLLGRGLGRLLFGTPPADTTTLLVVTIVLGVVTAAACLIPIRRALSVDPAEAILRH